MKYKKSLFLILLCLFISHEAFSDVKALKGIESIYVFIEPLSDDALDLGLTEERIRIITELKLRKEGITITDEESKFDVLFGVVITVKGKGSGKGVGLELKIKEEVSLIKNPSIICYAFTWNVGFIKDNVNKPEHVFTQLSNVLDYFLNDYYKANPKKIKE